MKWLEIIEICAMHEARASLENQITTLLKQIETQNQPVTVKVYRNGFLNTDFGIHLQYESDATNAQLSGLGEQISAALKEHGMVNHSLWFQSRKKHQGKLC